MGYGRAFYPHWALFFQKLVDVTRASDPPVSCGDRLSFFRALFNILDIKQQKGWFSTLHKRKIAERT